MSCKQSIYRNLYDNYIGGSYFGALDLYVLHPESPDERNKCVTTGFAVNKDPLSIISCRAPNFSFQYRVFDHIRHTEEVMSGTFSTDNKEFNHILHPFLREFMMGSVYIIYSEEFKNYELALAAKLAEDNQEDPVDRLERAYPDSNFRLLRRVPASDGEWRWDAVLSNVQNVELNEVIPVIDGEQIHPLRVSFDEGYFFLRLYHIFSTYESQMQVYDQLFLTLHKVGDINGEDTKSINTKLSQFLDPTVFTYTTISNNDSTTTIDNLDITRHLPQLTTSYDNIHDRLNHSLGRLGLAGNDSVKPERLTTGENFRALQPTAAFQQSVLNRLANLTERISNHFNQKVTFNASLRSNSQGIPKMAYTKEDPYKSVKPAMSNDKS